MKRQRLTNPFYRSFSGPIDKFKFYTSKELDIFNFFLLDIVECLGLLSKRKLCQIWVGTFQFSVKCKKAVIFLSQTVQNVKDAISHGNKKFHSLVQVEMHPGALHETPTQTDE